MTRKDISESVGNISIHHIQEAENYEPIARKSRNFKKNWGHFVVVAVVIFCLFIGSIKIFSSSDEIVVMAYTYETNQEITTTGAIINTGKINNDGEMIGHPLMFYLIGENIKTVRFSCKNQQISFIDWTEKRQEYGNVQNFTINYGQDESEYYYLTIDWIPNTIIRALTDNEEVNIENLSSEQREDIIVMEITFENGKVITKAINISLLDDGTFLAKFDDYKIDVTDDFVNRLDTKIISYDSIYNNSKIINSNFNNYIKQYNFNEKLSEKNSNLNCMNENIETAKIVAKDYYKNTVFEVISIKLREQTTNEISFFVCVSKDGKIQEPNHIIWLELINDVWEVVNEGY